MSVSVLAAAVCFIVCHGGPADHFATFVENLSKDVGTVEIYASGPALKKFQERGMGVKAPFSLDNLSSDEEDVLAKQIARACSNASVVITDVGHPFDIKVQKALAQQAKQTPRLAYYDNPEPYVPGGYSTVAAEVMLTAQGILFANSHLAEEAVFQAPGKEIAFGNRKRVGIGYYPIQQAEKIAQRRATEQLLLPQTLFSKSKWENTNQQVLVYFGGNNEEYFTRAFPAFLSLLEQGMDQFDFSNIVIVVQQHPGAKSKNLDGSMLSAWISQHNESKQAPKIILSDFSSEEAQVIADMALYYQTSMGPQFVLAAIPTAQIGHETFEDILVRNHLIPSVTSVDQLIHIIEALNDQKKAIPHEIILERLGIKTTWLQILEIALKNGPG